MSRTSVQKKKGCDILGAEIDRLEIEIETTVAKVNKGLDGLISRLDRVSGSLGKIDTSKLVLPNVNNYTSQVNKASNKTEVMADAFKQLSQRMTVSRRSFSQMAGVIVAGYNLATRGIKKLTTALEESMDYVETYNYFSVTMDKIGKEFGKDFDRFGEESAEAYASSFKTRLSDLTRKMTGYEIGLSGELISTDSIGLGLDPEEVINFQSSVAAITNSVGLIGENSINASKALTMLAADMSSLKNVKLSTAMTNFQSGLIGQSRALYKYGIDITNATLQTYAYDLGLSKAVSEMTQAEKMQLRLIAILDQSKVAWGDQANTINSVANQYRIMQQQFSNLARVIGNLFLPIAQKVLPVINGMIIALQKLFSVLGLKLFGGNWLQNTMDGISGVGGSNYDDLENSTEGTADNLENASEAAKKLKSYVLGIDELNVITPDAETSGSGINGDVGSIDLSSAIADALVEYETIWDKAFADSENKAQEYADNICSVFNRIWGAIEPFRIAVKQLWDEGLSLLMGYTFQNLKDFYNEFLVPMGKWAFGTEDSGLTRLVNIIDEQLMRVDWVWISDNLRKFWKALEPYAEQFGEGLIDFFEDISIISVDIINKIFGKDGAITGLTDWLEENDPEKARDWGYALGVLALGITALGVAGTIIVGIATLGNTIAGIMTGLGVFGDAFTTIGSKFSSMFAEGGIFGSGGLIVKALEGIQELILTLSGGAFVPSISAVGIALAALAAGIALVFATNENVRKSFADLANTLISGLGPVLEKIGKEIIPIISQALSSFWNNILVPLGELISSVLSPILIVISEALKMLCENIIIPLAEVVGTVFIVALQELVNVFDFVLEKVGGIITTFEYMWTSVFVPIAAYLLEKFKPTFEKVFKVIHEIIDNLGVALKGLIKFVSGVFTGDWEKAWNGVKDIFKGIFNSLITIAEVVINKIIDGINKFISGFNGVANSIGEVIGVDIQIPLIASVSLPRFENGGFPETGQLFLARENGINEMVGHIGNRPAVANNDQIIQGIAYGVKQALREAGSSDEILREQNALLREQNELLSYLANKEIVASIDPTRETVRGLREAEKRYGFSFIGL